MEIKEKMDAFLRMCKENGLKITPQRMAIYKILLESDAHPCAKVVFSKIKSVFPNISMDTVNQTLLTLNEMGSAFIVEGTGDVRRFDANLKKHQHFRCLKCNRIIDFNHKSFDDICTPKDIVDRFKVLRKTVYFEGICDSCLQYNYA